MSTEETKALLTPPERTAVDQSYRGISRVDDGGIGLVSDLRRAPVRIQGQVADPLSLREALSVLHEIVSSDMRYKPKDR
ncbi:MAG: hypothetical protein HN348_34255, partial [Proteobacteria bacterium]|nr:hypothetical protein [Pseudomonadota bacterium]